MEEFNSVASANWLKGGECTKKKTGFDTLQVSIPAPF